MANYVKDFTVQAAVYSDTYFPVQVRGGGNPNGDRAISMAVVLAFVVANMTAADVQTLAALIPGPYDSDGDATTAGVTSGQIYRTSAAHDVIGNTIRFLP